jgi:hypothetical protein
MRELKTEIERALSRLVCGGWDRNFLQSILEQIGKGRNLSAKQRQTLAKVLARNTAADQDAHENWAKIYESQYKKSGEVLAKYHLHQPYYKPMSRDILRGVVPERNKFLRMHDNKYSQKVLSEHCAAPKYKAGDYVLPRANFDSYKHAEFENDMMWSSQNKTIINFKKRGGFVLVICDDIRSSAKGAKRYKLLPIGETMPLIVEERFLKLSKKKK